MTVSLKKIRNAGCPRDDEFNPKSGEAIKPGYLLIPHSATEVKKHNTAGGAVYMVADRMPLDGRTLADVYADDDRVAVLVPQKGNVLNLVLLAAENVAFFGPLKSNGAGKLVAQGGAGTIIAYAMAASNVAYDTHIPVLWA